MVAVDTNVLLRILTRDDSRQTALADSFIENGAWVPIVALVEAVWVLGSFYGQGPLALATAIEMLLNHRSLVLQDHETVAAALDLFRARPGLGLSDCLILHLAKKAGHLQLGTFDRNLAKAEGAQEL
jgi:predicted nucleic-acid-binding protein